MSYRKKTKRDCKNNFAAGPDSVHSHEQETQYQQLGPISMRTQHLHIHSLTRKISPQSSAERKILVSIMNTRSTKHLPKAPRSRNLHCQTPMSFHTQDLISAELTEASEAPKRACINHGISSYCEEQPIDDLTIQGQTATSECKETRKEEQDFDY